jgi:hypothetical protein
MFGLSVVAVPSFYKKYKAKFKILIVIAGL